MMWFLQFNIQLPKNSIEALPLPSATPFTAIVIRLSKYDTPWVDGKLFLLSFYVCEKHGVWVFHFM